MTPDAVIAVVKKALEVTVLLSGPLLLVSLIVGVMISLVQSVTQIQEQTLTFVPKFLAVIVVFLLSLPWAIDVLSNFALDLFSSFSKFAR